MVDGNLCVTFSRVTIVGVGDHGGVEGGLDCVHGAFCFEATGKHGLTFAAQPVARRHRGAVVEQRGIAKHDRVAVERAHGNLEAPLRVATEKFGDASAI